MEALRSASVADTPTRHPAQGVEASWIRRDSALRRLLAAADSIAILLALAFAAVGFGTKPAGQAFVWGLVPALLIIFIFKLYGLYDRDLKRISHSTVDDLPWLTHATVIGTLALWLYARYTPMGRLDFMEVVVFGLCTILLVATARFVVRTFAARLIGSERALVIGGGQMTRAVVTKLLSHPEYRVQVVGALLPMDGSLAFEGDELPVLGSIDDLAEVAAWHKISRVVFAGRDTAERELEHLLRQCRALSLKVSLLPRLSDVLGPAVEIDDVEGVTVLGVNPPWLPRSSRALKRAMDIAVAGVLLAAAVPLLVIAAIAIKLDSPGPVFFGQLRIGKNGRPFRLWKLRTMAREAAERHAELLAASTDPGWLKLDRDPRITRVGRRLRRLSLDELPQLWNVLRGEMSMVGPRPLIPLEDERVQGWGRGRLDLTPGITGYWQVLGRTHIPFEEMVKLDYLYVMNWSLWEDIRLMLRTVPAVFTGKGAN